MTDLFPARSLSMPLALLNATPWAGIVLGLVAGGAAIQGLHATPALMLALVPGVAAMLLLLTLPARTAASTAQADAQARRAVA